MALIISFDAFDETLKEELRKIFWQHGIPLVLGSDLVEFTKASSPCLKLPPPQLVADWSKTKNDTILTASVQTLLLKVHLFAAFLLIF